MSKRPECPNCGKLLVLPAGPPNAPILLVVDYPEPDDVIQGRPFSGKSGEILKEEMGRVGLQLNQFRTSTLWMHQTAKKGEPCKIDFHLQSLIVEMQDRQFILLMGSETTKVLCKRGIMEVSSMRVTGPFIPNTAVAIAAPSPSSVRQGGVGEFRLALQRFKEVTNVS